jgi:hypothetical protein
MISVIYLVMQDADGLLAIHSWNGTVVFLGKLALAAGACKIAAGVLRSTKGKCWLLVFINLALGVIQYGFVRFRIRPLRAKPEKIIVDAA